MELCHVCLIRTAVYRLFLSKSLQTDYNLELGDVLSCIDGECFAVAHRITEVVLGDVLVESIPPQPKGE